MNVWKKIRGFVIGFGSAVIAFVGAILIWNNRKRYDQAIGGNEQEIGDSIDRQGKSIDDGITRVDDSISRIDSIKNTIGNDEDRKRETTELVDESRKLRERAEKFLGGE